MVRDGKEFCELVVEIFFGELALSSFVAAGFEELRSGGERNRTEGFHEVKKSQGGAEEEERLAGADLGKERLQMEAVVFEEKGVGEI